jgi:hypothetical protein
MQKKFLLITLIVILIISATGLIVWSSLRSSNTVRNSTVAVTQSSSSSSSSISSISSISSSNSTQSITKSSMSSKANFSSLSNTNTTNNGVSTVSGYVVTTFSTATSPIKLCFVSTTSETKKCTLEPLSTDSPDNIVNYSIAGVPFGEYDLQYEFLDSIVTYLPESGSLLDNGAKFKVKSSTAVLNIAPETFEELKEQKKAKVESEFGSRPDCLKKNDFYYKCGGIGNPRPTN